MYTRKMGSNKTNTTQEVTERSSGRGKIEKHRAQIMKEIKRGLGGR